MGVKEIANRRVKLNKPIHILLGALLLLGLILLIVFISWVLNYAGNNIFIPYLLLSLSLLFLISITAWLIYQIIRKKHFIKEQEIARKSRNLRSPDRNINNFRMQLKMSINDKALQETLRGIKIIKFNDDIIEKHCSISKIKFKAGEEVFQCPYCKSLYKRNYLIKWLAKNDICPVCRYKIIVRS